jgi:chromosome segregation ATPase
MEEIIKGALNALISQGGGYVISALLIVVVWAMDKKHSKAILGCDERYEKSQEAVKLQYEKRLEHVSELTNALNRSSSVLAALQVSVETRNATIQHLVSGFSDLVKDLEINRERWADRGEIWTKQLENIKERIEELQRRPQ